MATPLMGQSISGPIISVLTFEEPSPHFCSDGAGAVWHFHHTEAFVPLAVITFERGGGYGEFTPVAPSPACLTVIQGFSNGSGMKPCSLSDLITPRIR